MRDDCELQTTLQNLRNVSLDCGKRKYDFEKIGQVIQGESFGEPGPLFPGPRGLLDSEINLHF